MSQPQLSVVIPTWNRAHLLPDAIDSALAQSEGQVEVIVVDDGSTDNTLHVVKRRFGDRVKLLQKPNRTGVGAARNLGVSHATGGLLAFLDSDDVWLPGKLNAELSALERFPEAEVIVSDSCFIANGKLRQVSRFEENGALAATGGRIGWMVDSPWLWTACHNGLSTCSITLTRKTVARLGEPLFAEDLTSCEDWELEARIYQSCRVLVMPSVWSHVRWINDDSRIGRACPGTPPTREQEIGLLRDRLTAMNRSVRVGELTPPLAAEFQRYRSLNQQRLAELEQVEC